MGYKITWDLTSDLTEEEVAEVKEVVRRNILPGLQAMSLRKRDLAQVSSLLSKFAFFLFVQKKNAKYYSRTDSAVFGGADIAIAPLIQTSNFSEALIPYSAGRTSADALGPQACLTLAILSVISTLTNKVKLMEVEASSLNDVKVELKLIEKHSGIKFENLESMLEHFEEITDATPMLI